MHLSYDKNRTKLLFKTAFIICIAVLIFKTPHPAYAHFYGTVFIDTNKDGVQDDGDAGVPNLTIDMDQTNGDFDTSTKTTANGSYIENTLDCPAVYTVNLVVPPGYLMTTANPVRNASIACGVGTLVNFGIIPIEPTSTPTPTPTPNPLIPTATPSATPTPGPPTPLPTTFSISGGVFTQIFEPDQTPYAPQGTIVITGPRNQNVTTTNGTFTTAANLPPGTYTVSYTSLPGGYYMSYPLNGPPPSFLVTVGAACSTNNVFGAACNYGSITNLDFGITDTVSWMQSMCSDVRIDQGVNNLEPAGQYMIATNANCIDPGIVYTGNNNANFGHGNASSSNQIVGGAQYPEVYQPQNTPDLSTSYTNLLAKAEQGGVTPVNMSSVCTLTNCTLPANLPHGIYLANGDVILNNFTFPANKNYVFLVNGNLTIEGAISVPVGSTALFSALDNITITANVGNAPNVTASSLDGWYVAGQSFIIESAGSCNDLRLTIAGSVVVNALGRGGILQNARDLCSQDTQYPTVSLNQRPDLVLNAPSFVEQQQTISQEEAP